MLRCEEVTRLCASGGLSDASAGKRLRVRFHLLMCRHCSRYVAQLRAIGRSLSEIETGEEENPRTDEMVRKALATRGARKGP